jgi:streptogramin lyase
MTDAAGNLYQVNGTTLQELAPPYTGSPTTVATGFTNPLAGAIDGAGNLYVADSGLGTFGEVVKLAPGCASIACATVLYAPTLHPSVVGVAVDGLGDVFIADNPTGILELPANGGSLITLYSPGGNSAPHGVAVDGAGNVFVADPGLPKVVEIPPGCTTAGCQITVGSGWGEPESVAVDAAGDVIVADFTLTVDGEGDAGGVLEVPAGCTTSACQILLLTLGAPDPYAVTASPLGQLFVASDAGSVEINLSQPPAVSFGNVNDGLNTVQTVTLQNIGNEPLNSEGVSGLAVTGTYFLGYTSVGGTPYCSAGASFQVTPGQICDIGIMFEPATPGARLGTVVITDNALNGAPATQTINLSGVGVATGYTIGGSVSGLAGSGLVLQDNLANNL